MTKRTIKFRAKRTDKNWWVYGYLFKTPLTTENFNCTDDRNWFDEGKGRWCIVHEHGVVFEIDEGTVGQFTGKCGENGAEIYEGDIVIFNSRGLPFTAEVIYSNFGYEYLPIDDFSKKYSHMLEPPGYDIKIIGNIHDNPELLKL